MLRFGLPSGLNWFFEFFAFNFFVNVIVAGLGTTALAALMAVIQLNSVAFMPAFGVASAGAILVGQAIGAGRKDEVPTLVVAGLPGLRRLAGAGRARLPGLAPRWSSPRSPPIRSPGRRCSPPGQRMLMLSTAWQLFDAAAAVLAESLRAAGDTAFTLWARLAHRLGVFVPGAWVIGPRARRRRPGRGRLARPLPGGAGAGALAPLPERRLAAAHAGGTRSAAARLTPQEGCVTCVLANLR